MHAHSVGSSPRGRKAWLDYMDMHTEHTPTSTSSNGARKLYFQTQIRDIYDPLMALLRFSVPIISSLLLHSYVLHLCVIMPSSLCDCICWPNQARFLPHVPACVLTYTLCFWFNLLYSCTHTHTWLKAVVVVGVTQLLKLRNRVCEIGLLLNHHSLLSLSIIYGNVSIEPSWLTTANHKLNVLTSLKLLVKNKQMMRWNYLQSSTANTLHEASGLLRVCVYNIQPKFNNTHGLLMLMLELTCNTGAGGCSTI